MAVRFHAILTKYPGRDARISGLLPRARHLTRQTAIPPPMRFHRASQSLRCVFLTAAACLAIPSLQAAPPAGQLLSSMCAQCHGTNGQAVSGFESLIGKSAPEMYKSLLEMSTRRPENIMDLQARAFTPAQLRQIANYLATLRPAASN